MPGYGYGSHSSDPRPARPLSAEVEKTGKQSASASLTPAASRLAALFPARGSSTWQYLPNQGQAWSR
jgi:hypothetical protein